MSRSKSKVRLSLIKDQTQRRITYRKRKAGLKKKAYELSTLCDIPVLALFFEPSTGEVDSWSENAQEARDIMERYLSSSKKSRDESTFNPPSFSKAQACELQSDLENARFAKLQRLEAKIKSVDETIQLLEKGDIMAEGSFELGNSTRWQDLMQESIRCDSPCEVMMLGQSEVVKDSSMPDSDLVHGRIDFAENGSKKFIVSNESLEKKRIAFWKDLMMEDSMPECSFGAFLDCRLDSFSIIPPENSIGVFDIKPQMVNGDGWENCSDFGLDFMQNYPSISDFGAQKFLEEVLPQFI